MATGTGITAAPLHIDLHEGLVVLPAATEHLVRVKVVAAGQAHVGEAQYILLIRSGSQYHKYLQRDRSCHMSL